MAIITYINTTKNRLNEIPIKEGNIIYCSDSNTSFYDSISNIRIQIHNLDHIPTESIRELISDPVKDKIYIVDETKIIYKYTGNAWMTITHSEQIDTFLQDTSLVTPVELDVSGNKVSPKTLISTIVDEKGNSLEEILHHVIGRTKTGVSVGHVIANTNYQKVFTIPFPFENYLEYGNGFICMIGMAWVDPIRYTVGNGKLVFNDSDDGIAIGRKLSFIFIYSTVTPDIDSIEAIDGTSIIDGTIPITKFKDSARLMMDSNFVKSKVNLNTSLVEADISYDDPDSFYIGGSRASINLHLKVNRPGDIYHEVIATLPENYLPKVPAENVVVATNKGPMDLSIDKMGNIIAGQTLKPDYPAVINGTIHIMI